MAKKRLKKAEITLIGSGEAAVLTAQDTATEPVAKYALDEFDAGLYMQLKSGDSEYYVPFHAVDHIVVTETEAEVADRPNPYGCEPDGSVGGSRVGC